MSSKRNSQRASGLDFPSFSEFLYHDPIAVSMRQEVPHPAMVNRLHLKKMPRKIIEGKNIRPLAKKNLLYEPAAYEWLLYWEKVLSEVLLPWELPSLFHAVFQNYPAIKNVPH